MTALLGGICKHMEILKVLLALLNVFFLNSELLNI